MRLRGHCSFVVVGYCGRVIARFERAWLRRRAAARANFITIRHARFVAAVAGHSWRAADRSRSRWQLVTDRRRAIASYRHGPRRRVGIARSATAAARSRFKYHLETNERSG